MRPAFWTALLFATITAGLAAQSTSEKEAATRPAEAAHAHRLR